MENVKKVIITCCIVGLFVTSGYAAVGMNQTVVAPDSLTMSIQFQTPVLLESDGYVQFEMEGATTVRSVGGQPMVPIYRTKLTFPFGTKIIDVIGEPSDVATMHVSGKLRPAPQPVVADGRESEQTVVMDDSVYSSAALYPENWVTYYTGGGLDQNNHHATFLILEVCPLRYSPATDTIYYANDMHLTITTEQSTQDPFTANEDFKLVIIAPSAFEGDLAPLVTHKNAMGLTTMLKTTQAIYDEFDGVDKPEQIKYFIQYALENYQTQYVLLVGGLKSPIFGTPRDDRNQGTATWHVPVRYTNIRDEGTLFDPGYLSDLYYADIYDSVGNFSSWDSDDDGIFAKWDNTAGKDIIDHYPDVFVGRLPCRNKFEVRIMVKKIIAYEESPAGSWYNTIIAVAGDSHNDTENYNFNEGEIVTEKILTDYMSSFTPVKLYASNEITDPSFTPTGTNIVRAISGGGGHLVFDGHGNPFSWNTHWSNYGAWTGGIQVTSFPKLRNGEKLPVCVVGGCHNSQFNVTMLAGLTDKNNSRHMWCYGVPVPECWGWWMVRKVGGGAIASIGNTGLGYGYVGGIDDLNGDGIAEPVCVEGLGGYMQILFYKTIVQETNILGAAHSGALSKYMDAFPPMSERVQAKTVQEWALIGDPSLMMGGYSS